MGYDAEIKFLVMSIPALIKRSCIPKDNDPGHPSTIFSEKYKIALIVFIKLGLNEQESCDFPGDFFSDWETHVSPATSGDHVDRTLPLLETLLVQNVKIIEPTTRET